MNETTDTVPSPSAPKRKDYGPSVAVVALQPGCVCADRQISLQPGRVAMVPEAFVPSLVSSGIARLHEEPAADADAGKGGKRTRKTKNQGEGDDTPEA